MTNSWPAAPGILPSASSKIEVRVLGIKGNQVRIGIDAPSDVAVMRQELLSRKAPAPAETDPLTG